MTISLSPVKVRILLLRVLGSDTVVGDSGELTYVDSALASAISSGAALGDVDRLNVGEGDNIVIAGQGAGYCDYRFRFRHRDRRQRRDKTITPVLLRISSRQELTRAAMTISPRLAATIPLSEALVATRSLQIAAMTRFLVIMRLLNTSTGKRFA